MRTGDSLRLKNSLMIGGLYKIDDIAPVLGVNPIALKQTGVFRSIGSDAFVILVTLQKNPDTTQYMDILNEDDAILFWEGQTKRRIAEKAFGEGADCHVFIRDIPKLISELSQGITLEAGDIIISGTPAGVGMGFDPPRYMKPGDVIECEVEGIGVLRNRIRD